MENGEDLRSFVDVGGEPQRDREKGQGEWLRDAVESKMVAHGKRDS